MAEGPDDWGPTERELQWWRETRLKETAENERLAQESMPARAEDNTDIVETIGILIVVGIPFFVALCGGMVLLVQIIEWLQYGTWPGLLDIEFIVRLFPYALQEWAVAPTSWYGLHSLLNWGALPVCCVSVSGGWVLLVLLRPY